MTVTRVLHPYFACPTVLDNTPLEYSFIALIAGYFGIRESEVGYQGRPQYHEYDGFVMMPLFDGRIEFGIAERANQFISRDLPVFVITNGKNLTLPALRQFETNHSSGLFTLRMITADEQRRIALGDQLLVVPLLGD